MDKDKKATLVLMVGLPFSGKTTKAKQLAKQYNAIRLTPDEWQGRLFGHELDGKKRIEITNIMTELAFELLSKGQNVILDIGCWLKSERDLYRNKSKELGFDFLICYCEAPHADELEKRIDKRNAEDNQFIVTKEKYSGYTKKFQIPTDDEGDFI